VIVENIFFDRSDRINFCAEIMHRNFPPPNLCNLRPLLTIMLGRGWLPIPAVEVSRERPLLAESGSQNLVIPTVLTFALPPILLKNSDTPKSQNSIEFF